MNDVNYEEILKAIDSDYSGKSVEEVIDLLIETNNYNKIEKTLALTENADDDLLDLDDELKRLDEDYNNRIDTLQSEIEEINRERIAEGIKYREYGRVLDSEMGPFLNDHINYKIAEIDELIEEINHKEEILEGNLSARKKAERDRLKEEKEELLLKAVDFKDSQSESKYLALEKEKEVKKKQQDREELIKELENKKAEINEKIANALKVKNAYYEIIKKIGEVVIAKKKTADEKYNEVVDEYQKRMEKAINTKDHKDYESASEYSKVYVEADMAKADYTEKAYKIFSIIGVKPESLGIFIQKEESKKEENVNDYAKNSIIDSEENNEVTIEKIENEFEPTVEEKSESVDDNLNNNNYENELLEKEEATTQVSLENEVDNNIINEEDQLLNIPNDEPSLAEKVQLNKQKQEEINKYISENISSMEPDEVYCCNRLISIIELTNSKIENHEIEDDSVIRTSRDEYIYDNLLGEYNSVIDELAVIEKEKNMQQNNIITSEPENKTKEVEILASTINELKEQKNNEEKIEDIVEPEEPVNSEPTMDEEAEEEYENYGFDNDKPVTIATDELSNISSQNNEISENLTDVMNEDDEIVNPFSFEQATDESFDDYEDEDPDLEFLTPTQPAKLDDDFIDDSIDNVTAPEDLDDGDDDDFIEDEDLDNNITNISEDGKILDGNFYVPDEPQKDVEPEQIQPVQPLEPVQTGEEENKDESNKKEEKQYTLEADKPEVSSEVFLEKKEDKGKSVSFLDRIRGKKAENLSHPVLRAAIDNIFDEEAQQVYNNMLDESDEKKKGRKK